MSLVIGLREESGLEEQRQTADKRERYHTLDAIRGLSALAVCSGHLRAAALPDFRELTHSRSLLAPLYFATGLGHQAVMVFFVLSGFLIGGSVLRDPERFSLKRYFIARLLRLWVVLIPALVFTCLLDALVGFVDPSTLAGSHYAQWNSGPNPEAPADHSLGTMLGNLLFLQTILVPVCGTNGPLWSLANEFWYYAMFPLLVIAIGFTKAGGTARCLAGMVTVAICCFVPKELLQGFAFWCFGVIAWWFSDRLPRGRRLVLIQVISAAAFFGALALKSIPLPFVSSDLLVAMTFAVFAATIAHARGVRNEPLRRFFRSLSEISYSLYCFHFPMVVLLCTLLLSGGAIAPNFNGLLTYFVLLTSILTLSAALWWLFERHTESLRAWAMMRFG